MRHCEWDAIRFFMRELDDSPMLQGLSLLGGQNSDTYWLKYWSFFRRRWEPWCEWNDITFYHRSKLTRQLLVLSARILEVFLMNCAREKFFTIVVSFGLFSGIIVYYYKHGCFRRPKCGTLMLISDLWNTPVTDLQQSLCATWVGFWIFVPVDAEISINILLQNEIQLSTRLKMRKTFNYLPNSL